MKGKCIQERRIINNIFGGYVLDTQTTNEIYLGTPENLSWNHVLTFCGALITN